MTNCSPDQNQISANPPPLPPVPGFGVPSSPVQIPLDSFDLPANLSEDFNELVNSLQLLFPSGTFRPNVELPLKTVYDYVSNLLTQVSPYLSLFNFFMAALKMFICIIEILCAIPNPFVIAAKLKKLFAECLPDFLHIFPIFSLPIMILSILLLLLQLILYLIQAISDIVDSILNNLAILEKGLQLNDSDATLAAAQKIANLLCSLNNLLAIFVALSAILDVIKILAKSAGFLICDSGDTTGCCPQDICPDFLRLTPGGIQVTRGRLIYLSKIGFDSSTLGLPAPIAAIFNQTLGAIRPESWQIFDTLNTAQYPIFSIILPILPSLNIFFPNDLTYSKTTPARQAPYTVDLRFKMNPASFGIVDFNGPRFFKISDCIVVKKPHVNTINFDNNIDPSQGESGVLDIEGGLVFEDDGSPYKINNIQATLNTLIHQADINSTSLPVSDDSIIIDDVEFTWKPNVPALAGLHLTTVGCIPEVSLEKAVFNSISIAEGIAPIEVKFGPNFLPDVPGAQLCIQNAISTFRKNISAESTAEFKSATTTCLTNLQTQTNTAICSVISNTISQFKSIFSLNPDLQFTSLPIEIIVDIKDAVGVSIGRNIPSTCSGDLANQIKATPTFGTVTNFKYDGNQFFTANLSSDIPGSGTVTVSINDKILSTYTPGIGAASPIITENVLPFTFINAGVNPPVRRDASDLAKQEE